jgi:hypothetical protein
LLGASGCGACSHSGEPASLPTASDFLGFSAFVLCILMFLCTVCLCVAQILLKFLL